MAKKILKPGKLSKDDIEFIKANHKKMEPDKIADKLRRSQVQIDKYILENLEEHVEENKEAVKKAIPQVDVERVGTAMQMNPTVASIEVSRKKRADPEWVFRQPKK